MPLRDEPRQNRSKRTLTIAALAGTLIAAGAVGVAVGANDSEPQPEAAAVVYPNTKAAASAPSKEQQAAFGVLRREEVGRDALPASMAKHLSNTYAVKVAGLNASLARRAAADAGAVWVIPGNGSTCMVVNGAPVPDGGTELSQASATCALDDRATAGQLVMSLQFSDEDPDREFVAGLVPDGVEQVTAELSDGTERTITVHDNIYTGEFNGSTAKTVSFAGRSGKTVLRP